MQGKIIKGIAGFYYVHVETCGVYECKAKGIFRNRKVKPLVGDNVLIDVISKEECTGNIIEILPRKNELVRPAAANIDQAMVVFAITQPDINFNLLDRFILMMDYQKVPTIICFNKIDLAGHEEIERLKSIYEKCGCQVLFISIYDEKGIEQVMDILNDRTTVLAGPSGVGKSSLTNLILPKEEDVMETGGVSRIGRGRHTTRHSEIFHVSGKTYICDTPGFTSLMIPDMEKENLRFYFSEFEPYEGKCRFNGCMHVNEPDCAVKEAVSSGGISGRRYQSYTEIYKELKEQKKY
ncbi:MAG: ribosome small subunit-dependent GTPase A [Eubacteriales bacterium]|nr:ribosome small subunit-dependent GTPase A [Eubacteriales bacterium]